METEEKRIQKSVQWFAEQMENKLNKNSHKGSWDNCELQYLSMRLTQERQELRRAIARGNSDEIIAECADIGNFAMMIAEYFKKK